MKVPPHAHPLLHDRPLGELAQQVEAVEAVRDLAGDDLPQHEVVRGHPRLVEPEEAPPRGLPSSLMESTEVAENRSCRRG